MPLTVESEATGSTWAPAQQTKRQARKARKAYKALSADELASAAASGDFAAEIEFERRATSGRGFDPESTAVAATEEKKRDLARKDFRKAAAAAGLSPAATSALEKASGLAAKKIKEAPGKAKEAAKGAVMGAAGELLDAAAGRVKKELRENVPGADAVISYGEEEFEDTKEAIESGSLGDIIVESGPGKLFGIGKAIGEKIVGALGEGESEELEVVETTGDPQGKRKKRSTKKKTKYPGPCGFGSDTAGDETSCGGRSASSRGGGWQFAGSWKKPKNSFAGVAA